MKSKKNNIKKESTCLIIITLILLNASLNAQSTIKLSDQIVTATRIEIPKSKRLAEVTVINQDEIIKATANTVGELLSTKTGIEFTNNGGQGSSANVYIRGSKYNHVLVLIDGVRVGSLTLGSAQWSNMVLSNIDRIEIMRGPASSLYGSDAIGGVVQIFTKNPSRAGNSIFAQLGAGNYNAYSTDLGTYGLYRFINGQAIKYSLALGYKKSQEFNAISDNPEIKNNNTDKDGFNYKSSNYYLAYLFSPRFEIGIGSNRVDLKNHYDSSPTRSTPFSTDWQKDYWQKDRQQTNRIYIKNKFNDFWSAKLQYSQSLNYSDQYQDSEFENYYHSQQNQWQFKNEFKLPQGKMLAVYEDLEQQVNSNIKYQQTQRKINSWQLGWISDYQKHNWQINYRKDHNSQFNNAKTGFAGYGYQLTDSLRIYASASSGFKAPTMNDLYYPNSGNSQLKPEKSKHFELNIQYQKGDFDWSTTLFDNKINNMIVWKDDGSGNWKPQNTDNVRIKGASVDGQYSLDKKVGFIGLNYTYQDAEDLATGLRLNQRANKYGSLSIGQSLDKYSWLAKIVYRGERFADADKGIKLSKYSIVNFSANYYLRKNINLLLDINNIFNRNYSLVRDYQTGGRRLYFGFRIEH